VKSKTRIAGMETESEKGNIAGIIVAHGKLGQELLQTVEVIVGRVSDLHALSGSELCDEDVVSAIRKIIAEHEGHRALVFVDYFGGSCCINALKAAHGLKDVKVISGVNLPMLLDFVTKRDYYDFDEMISHIVARGKDSVKVVDF